MVGWVQHNAALIYDVLRPQCKRGHSYLLQTLALGPHPELLNQRFASLSSSLIMKCPGGVKHRQTHRALCLKTPVYWGHDSSTGMTGIVPKIATSTGPLIGLEGYSAPHPHPLYKNKLSCLWTSRNWQSGSLTGTHPLPALGPRSLTLTSATSKAL